MCDGALIDRDRNDLEKLLIEQFGLQSLYLDYTWSVAVSKPDTLRKICNYNWFQDGEGGQERTLGSNNRCSTVIIINSISKGSCVRVILIHTSHELNSKERNSFLNYQFLQIISSYQSPDIT